MTQDTKETLRVQGLAGYGLEVPDLGVAENFYSAFGLEAVRTGTALEFRSARTHTANIVVLKSAAQKRLHHLSFAVQPEEIDRFDEHLRLQNCATTSPPFGMIRPGLWFQDPWGTWINLTPVPPSAGTGAGAVAPSVNPAGPRIDRHLWRELNKTIKPNRLGHMLMFTQDWEKAENFYCATLGLRVTDRASGKVSFMAAGSGVRDHHCFGLIKDTHRGFQHSSFHVPSVDEIGFGAVQMHKAGYKSGFGVGRHAIASNLFYYTRDPWGSWVEYYSDMDMISEAWVATDWNDLPYVWPQWAPEFWSKEMNANLEAR